MTMAKEFGISDLPGVGAATIEKLSAGGYDTLMSIAVSTPGELTDASGVTETAARKMIQAARSNMDMGFQSGEDLLAKRELLKFRQEVLTLIRSLKVVLKLEQLLVLWTIWKF